MSTEQAISYALGPFGTLFLVIIILVTGYKKFWVFGWYAKELHERNILLEQQLGMLLEETKEIVSHLDE